MNKSPPNIWFNVTTSENWKRPPVGIVRVEKSLCDELSKLYGDRLRKCIWCNGEFIDFDCNSSVPSEYSIKKENSKVDNEFIYPILSIRQVLINIVQIFLSLTPVKFRRYNNKFLLLMKGVFLRVLKSRFYRAVLGLKKSSTSSLNEVGDDNLDIYRVNYKYLLFKPGDILVSIGLDWDNDFYHHFYDLRKNYGVKVVTCCYDLIPVMYPQYCVGDVSSIFTSYFSDIADGSDLVLCISKQSEKDLKNMLYSIGGRIPSTFVFNLGDNVDLKVGGEISPTVRLIADEPFILYVSTIERRKNHEILYRAYHLLCAKGQYNRLPKLVFVGMQGWGVSDILKDMELDPLTKGKIVRLNHVSDVELKFLYEQARFCVFPSLYEGWGLPVAEALAHGKPVICSDRGSLPEVGGDLVRYVDPWNAIAWADEIYELSTNDKLISKIEAKIRSEYKKKDWKSMALIVKKRIDELMN